MVAGHNVCMGFHRTSMTVLLAMLLLCMQIRDEDLQSGGNQDKARELQVEDQIEDAEKEQEYQTQMDRGLAVEETQPVSLYL